MPVLALKQWLVRKQGQLFSWQRGSDNYQLKIDWRLLTCSVGEAREKWKAELKNYFRLILKPWPFYILMLWNGEKG